MENIAINYLEAGLCPLPAVKVAKRPAVGSWKVYQSTCPTPDEVRTLFATANADAICVICGAVSGDLEVIDFDDSGSCFAAWCTQIPDALREKLVMERTPGGGSHVFYRAPEIEGNQKLASGMRNGKFTTLIETRGEGGLVLCAPTDGYVLTQGDLTRVPILTRDERATLLNAARAFDEAAPHAAPRTAPTASTAASTAPAAPDMPDFRHVLEAHGWEFVRQDERNEHWRRPGKDGPATSATFNGECFYVFSSNAEPFQPNKPYSVDHVLALLAPELAHPPWVDNVAAHLIAASPAQPDTTPTPNATTSPGCEVAVEDLERAYPSLRESVLKGLLRRGEIMNIIAPPKSNKSWMVLDLATSLALGRPWLGYSCTPGKVLIIDNELHRETTAYRLRAVRAARGIQIEDVAGKIFIDNQRGRLESIADLKNRLEHLKKRDYSVIIIDALYRALGPDVDENSNGEITRIYNMLDEYASYLNCSFVLVHHATKGCQAGKAVSDVGAGAGSQARATDTHLILRQHQEKDVVVLDACVRSWMPVESFCLRWDFPVWTRADSFDPTLLDGVPEKKVKQRTKKKSKTRTAVNLEEIVAQAQSLLAEDPDVSTSALTEKVRKGFDLSRDNARIVARKILKASK